MRLADLEAPTEAELARAREAVATKLAARRRRHHHHRGLAGGALVALIAGGIVNALLPGLAAAPARSARGSGSAHPAAPTSITSPRSGGSTSTTVGHPK